jgi:hypothetical protein
VRAGADVAGADGAETDGAGADAAGCAVADARRSFVVGVAGALAAGAGRIARAGGVRLSAVAAVSVRGETVARDMGVESSR